MAIRKDLGAATAYALAVEGGYSGTQEQYEVLLASYGTVAQQARQYKEDTEAFAVGTRNGTEVGSTDPAYHNNAAYYATEITDAASTATQAKQDALDAKTDAVTAKNDAVQAKTDAVAAKNDAVQAKNDAVQAKTDAVDAKNDAVSAKTDAQTAKTAAETAQGKAETAQGKAEDAQAAAETAAASLVIDSALSSSSTNPVQNKVINAELSDLKSHLNQKMTIINGYTVRSDNGGSNTDANGSTVEMLVVPGIVISGFTFAGLDIYHGYAFYDENGKFISGGNNIGAGTYNWNYNATAPAGAYIFKISCKTSYLSSFKALYSGTMDSVINCLKLLALSDVIIEDYYNVPQTVVNGKTIRSNAGSIITSANDSYVEIPVVPGVKLSGHTTGGLDVNHGYAFYDADGFFISGGNNIGAGTYDWQYSVTAPANANIFRISCTTSYISSFTAYFEDVINSTLKAVSKIPVNNVFYCGATRTLNTLKKGIEKATKYKNSVLYVDPGEYDLVDEFGSSWFDGLTSSDTQSGLQLGNGIHIIFSPNSKVISHYDGSNQYAQSYYSPFNIVEGGFKIENLTLECSRCRYAIHDERNGATEQCKSEYINCTISIDNTNNLYWTSATCIGGGLGSNHSVSIFGSKFSAVPTGEKARAGIYYHMSNNTSNPDHRCIIDIQGNYLATGTVMLDFTRTDASEKTQVIVANNSLLSVDGKQANGLFYGNGFTADCADIMAWNNEIRT